MVVVRGVGISGSSSSQELGDPCPGHPELFGGLEGVDVAGLDLIQDCCTRVFGRGDLLRLPGSSWGDVGVDTLHGDVVGTPVTRVSDHPAQPTSLSGGLEVLLGRVNHRGVRRGSMVRLVTSAATTNWSVVATAWAW